MKDPQPIHLTTPERIRELGWQAEDWLFYALRGLQRTLRSRVLRGIAQIRLDRETPAHERPIPARKPKDQRARIALPAKPSWPKGRSIQSANNLRRATTASQMATKEASDEA